MNTALTILPGDRYFCTCSPAIVAGHLLPSNEFGARILEAPVMGIEVYTGEEEVRRFFAESSLSAPVGHDFSRPVRVERLRESGALRALELGELILEVVRLRDYAHLPSRLQCLFLWRTEDQARDFFSRRPWPVRLCEVEVEHAVRACGADIDIISWIHDEETTASLMARAHKYWAPKQGAVLEILFEGSVRVVRVIAGP